jgi:asparagine synthase (glutamine-hydrolysing)
VCAFARQHVTVALTGDGGDELFAGYDPFRALNLARAYQAVIPGGVHRWVSALVGKIPLSDRNMSLDFKLRRTLRGLDHGPALWNPVWMAPLAVNEIAELFNAPVDAEELYADAITVWNDCESKNIVDRTSEFFTRFYLQDDILTKSDRASMLESLELRAPFLDNDLVAFAQRLPARFKYRRGTTKYLLRRAVGRDLPTDIVARPKKGFGIPLSAWLRELPAPSHAHGNLPLDEAWLTARWDEHTNRTKDWRHALWCWMTLRDSASHQMGSS